MDFYFEADPDTAYRDDLYAIDTMRACSAKLIRITPKMREAWRHTAKSQVELGRNRTSPRQRVHFGVRAG